MKQSIKLHEKYQPLLDIKQTEKAIKIVKDGFQQNIASELKLRRVTAPIIIQKGTGVNDDLNGIEKPVSFKVKSMNNIEAEVVQSLAKWKRMALADYDIQPGFGIYTDMNAIRPDEELDNLHSLYVDQWDWEMHITKEQRNLDFLKDTVRKIYAAFKRTEFQVYEHYPQLAPYFPEEIHFIHAEDLLKKYPDLNAKEREHSIAEKYGAVFIIGIGAPLANGEKHDGRAPDYDDWITETENGYHGLNGDIVIWHPTLKIAFELSSMGIRVDKESLIKQLKHEDKMSRTELNWHKRLLNDNLPLSIGGGIGQSRLCMLLLKKVHIGEVQASMWPEEMISECREQNIFLL